MKDREQSTSSQPIPTGRNILIAGATGVIGRALANSLACNGDSILAIGLDSPGLSQLIEDLPTAENQTHRKFSIDATNPDQVSKLGQELEGLEIKLDGFVHAIGLTSHEPLPGYVAPLAEQTLTAWNQAISTNLTTAFLLAQTLHPHLRRSQNAAVVFVSSIYGTVGADPALYEGTSMGNPLAYGASKGGLNQMTRYLAAEWGPSIRVNSVSPGGIFANQPDDFVQRYNAKTPLKRMANAEDIVGPIAFLIGKDASYITGQNLHVDGGFTSL